MIQTSRHWTQAPASAPQRDAPSIGGYRVERRLAAGPHGQRWLVRRSAAHQSHRARTLHVLPARPSADDWARLCRLRAALNACDNAHIGALLDVGRLSDGRLWCVGPFFGDAGGSMTLQRLVRLKSGRLTPAELMHAAEQLLGAIAVMHRNGVRHGPMVADEILIDRRGRLVLEMPGVARALRDATFDRRATAGDDVRGVASLICWLGEASPAVAESVPAPLSLPRRAPEALRRWVGVIDRLVDPALTGEAALSLLSKQRRRFGLRPS